MTLTGNTVKLTNILWKEKILSDIKPKGNEKIDIQQSILITLQEILEELKKP